MTGGRAQFHVSVGDGGATRPAPALRPRTGATYAASCLGLVARVGIARLFHLDDVKRRPMCSDEVVPDCTQVHVLAVAPGTRSQRGTPRTHWPPRRVRIPWGFRTCSTNAQSAGPQSPAKWL